MFIRISAAVLFIASTCAPVAASAPETQTASSVPAQANPDDKIKCRRIAVTGSFIKGEKICKTVAEWRRLSDRGNEAVRDLMDTGRTCAGGACGNGG